MDAIQTKVSPDALTTAIRTNLYDFLRHISTCHPRDRFENERFTRWHTPFPHPWFNGVLTSDIPKHGVRSFIAESIRFFHEKAVDTFTWWTAPRVNAAEWRSVLSEHNFGFSAETAGMAVDLQEMNGFVPRVEGLEICPVEEEKFLQMWATVFTRGCGLPPQWERVTFDLWSKLGIHLPMRNYVGFLNGKPVSTASLFVGGGAAGVYGVSTVPEARGKGLGTTLTIHALRDARDLGYRVGVLHSSRTGNGLHERLGIRHLCQIEHYYLTIL